MGCTSSKRIEDTVVVDAYRPAPTTFSVFDVYAIQEPWLQAPDTDNNQKPSHLPPPILNTIEDQDGPRPWDEVSKVLEDLKPKLSSTAIAIPKTDNTNPTPAPDSPAAVPKAKPPRRKSFSFHTLEELEARISSKFTEKTANTESKRVDPLKSESTKLQSKKTEAQNGVPKSLRDNIFIVRDKLEREREGNSAGFVKRDPLSDFPENCPPGGSDAVVLYTTSLGGVRRTYEDCKRVRSLMETHQIVFDERDISLHGGFLNELKELLGEGVSVPRVFVKGRYVGGVDEVVQLNETGRLVRILNWARVERGVGRLGCEGCGGARFVPCLECGGSCKVMVADMKQRCGMCNENGLVHCPVCI